MREPGRTAQEHKEVEVGAIAMQTTYMSFNNLREQRDRIE